MHDKIQVKPTSVIMTIRMIGALHSGEPHISISDKTKIKRALIANVKILDSDSFLIRNCPAGLYW